eukprot:TRINITY_DN8108_c0_g1_i2.p1 TRINITY_DN8108_c0_g1~~TRINITY_DN8108_c0_g1_i2.p1  ORF type:complete len:194 (+),score=15.01 TRINITY_DN8108_c0_g1_i2:602-1183(+)
MIIGFIIINLDTGMFKVHSQLSLAVRCKSLQIPATDHLVRFFSILCTKETGPQELIILELDLMSVETFTVARREFIQNNANFAASMLTRGDVTLHLYTGNNSQLIIHSLFTPIRHEPLTLLDSETVLDLSKWSNTSVASIHLALTSNHAFVTFGNLQILMFPLCFPKYQYLLMGESFKEGIFVEGRWMQINGY